jgi:hypothetical protein
MSVLERFVRIRSLRACAVEYFEMAFEPCNADVRDRYLRIADYYIALAESELRSDKFDRQEKLKQLRADRAAMISMKDLSAPIEQTPKPVKLRVIQGGGAGADGFQQRSFTKTVPAAVRAVNYAQARNLKR